MKIISLLPILMLMSCGKVEVEHKGQVDVNVKFDLGQITTYFAAQCKRDLPSTATPEEITDCTNAGLADFLSLVEQLNK